MGTYSAIALSLKQGWNLVQRDRQNNTFTIKIADKNVPGRIGRINAFAAVSEPLRREGDGAAFSYTPERQ